MPQISQDSLYLYMSQLEGHETCQRYCEKLTKERIEGTIIDLETIGEFNQTGSIGRYKHILPITAGFFCEDKIEIFYISGETPEDFNHLRTAIQMKLRNVLRPFYAFNSDFEMGVLYWFLGSPVVFDRDLMMKVTTDCGKEVWESKRIVVEKLGIPNFDDPFCDMGFKVPCAWREFQSTHDDDVLENIVLHNRACLLKEYMILTQRGRWRNI
jgi:hypothetical protein